VVRTEKKAKGIKMRMMNNEYRISNVEGKGEVGILILAGRFLAPGINESTI